MEIEAKVKKLTNFKLQKDKLQKAIPVFLLLAVVFTFTLLRRRYSNFVYQQEFCQAFVGDKWSRGGHRVRLAKDKDFLEIFFVKAGNFEIPKLKPSSLAKLVEEDGEQMIKFEEIVEGADFFYRYTEAGIQQLMILKNTEVGKKEFAFKLNTSGLTYNDVGNGVWYFYPPSQKATTRKPWMNALERVTLRSLGVGGYNKKQKPIFRLTRSYAKDSAGHFCNEVLVGISQEEIGGKKADFVKFKIEDENWLTDADRQFPVAIYSNLEVIPEKRAEWVF